ncbi:pyridoxamine 5'-phosphate oxidase family protein [Streptomyces sp. NPDC001137]|uniref:pyridoxamine 5'-phosphate oxidase family protein n=1 Tax=Streptomyces sp. NPDC001137 TaxID=3154378 RepID=UPI00331B40E7
MNVKLEGHIRERLPAPNFWHLATVGADGMPHVSPMWADIEDECAMVNTSIGRVKIDNLRLNPNVSLALHEPHDPPPDLGPVVRVAGVVGVEPFRAGVLPEA